MHVSEVDMTCSLSSIASVENSLSPALSSLLCPTLRLFCPHFGATWRVYHVMAVVEDMELHKAAFEGDLERLKELLDAGTYDINGFDKHGNTPLVLALHFKKNDVVTELIARGADSGTKTKAGWSPIRYAVASANVPNIRAIHRANINRERVNLLQRLPTMIASLKAVRTEGQQTSFSNTQTLLSSYHTFFTLTHPDLAANTVLTTIAM